MRFYPCRPHISRLDWRRWRDRERPWLWTCAEHHAYRWCATWGGALSLAQQHQRDVVNGTVLAGRSRP